MTALQTTIRKLTKQHGGVRPAARALGVDHGYLWRLMNGVMDNPDDELLAKLGLERRVIYRTIERAPGSVA